MRRYLFTMLALTGLSYTAQAQKFTHQDTLRGSVTPERAWWNVQHYDLNVAVDIPNKSLSGYNIIRFSVNHPGQTMQVDLQSPMHIDSVFYHGQRCKLRQDGNAWFVQLPIGISSSINDSISVHFSGTPRAAKHAPWDGGLVWQKDAQNRDWVGVACQGLGASVWWPNKDYQGDEPDRGMRISVTVPKGLTNISNGRLTGKLETATTTTWTYDVVNAINNYDATLNIGNYVTLKDTFNGLKGVLDMEYVVLDYNKDKALKHLQHDAKTMLRCFEYWFGPYPFYEDGYRLVETSYLGMEHQGAIAYGNKFKKGYLGMDRSGTGFGKYWDYIVVHESGHEWFGNNITAADIADMWIQEAFTTYSEALYIECTKNKDAADKYVRGLRKNLNNDRNIIGAYGVNDEGSGDMYDKGANMLLTIREIIDNDSTFRAILQGLNRGYAQQTISTRQVENYMMEQSGKNLQPLFDVYLRTTEVPVFEYRPSGKNAMVYRFTNVPANFTMPIKVTRDGKTTEWWEPTTQWTESALPGDIKKFKINPNFFIESKLLPEDTDW
jgi:aminopeptidase N